MLAYPLAHFVKITFQPRQYHDNESDMKMKLMECSLRADNFSHAGACAKVKNGREHFRSLDF